MEEARGSFHSQSTAQEIFLTYLWGVEALTRDTKCDILVI